MAQDFVNYVTEFVIDQGYADATSIEEGVRRFNQDQRTLHGTDWAFTIFVVDSSDDQDRQFAAGPGHRGAFAFPGGLFMVVPSTRTAEIFAHELGHIFWAMDEYLFGASWQDQRGYYNGNALNAADNPAENFEQEISIMRGFTPLEQAFDQRISPASTLAFVGWQDTDGDGVFDVADVPLDLQASGYFDPETSEYHFSGSASAVPLMNRNSAGPQSDITFNRVSQIQYRLDDGDWIDAAVPDQQVVEFDILMEIEQSFDTIQWRARDSNTGVVSEILTGTPVMPALTAASVAGLAFIDANNDQQRGANEIALESATVVVRNADGSPLFRGHVDAGEQPDGFLSDSLAGVTITVNGEGLNTNAGAFTSADAGAQAVFYHYDPLPNRWSEAWSGEITLGAEFDQPVGQVTLDVVGVHDGGFGRLEAFDAQGQLLTRATSHALATGEVETITVNDPQGRIVSVRASGHAKSEVGFRKISFGIVDTFVTDPGGSWSFQNLADGQYMAEFVPERVIHQFENSSVSFEVSGGSSDFVMSNVELVDSIRHNAALPEDANGQDGVTSLDALVIINDLGRNSQRILQPGETDGFDVDVNNDGIVSALDALLVINFLGRGDSEGQSDFDGGVSALKTGPMLNLAGSAVGVESTGGDPADTDVRATDIVTLESETMFMPRRQEHLQRVRPTDFEDSADGSEGKADQPPQTELGADFDRDFKEPFAGFEV